MPKRSFRSGRFGRRTLLRAGAAAAGALALGPRPGGARAAGPLDTILAYHERSKHRIDRSAPAPGRVDWDAQPDPFRRFAGAPLLPLPLEEAPAAPTWDAVMARAVPARPLDRASLSRLLLDSLALSAWKEGGGDRWSLRVNPSSGNLHPTEVYLAGGPFPGLTEGPAVLHYAPHEHGLERLAALPGEVWPGIAAGLPPRALLAGITQIHWREAWKYGERGWRYSLLDAGHAVAALSVAAAALGWRARLAEGWTDRAVARLVGADRQSGPEAERAEALLALWPGTAAWPRDAERGFRLGVAAFEALGRTERAGVPNRLSAEHRSWPAMDAAARAAERAEPPGDAFWSPEEPPDVPASRATDRGHSARALFRQRRTALDYERSARIPSDALFALLRAAMPAVNRAIFDPLPWRPAVHLALFVHRVDGLAPGVYLLPRDAAAVPELRGALGAGEGRWIAVEGAPPEVPLLRLAGGDLRDELEAASCDQEIAADGVLTAAMLARFEPPLRTHGAWMYRRLHLEAGAVGHALYLEAEAAGLRGTAMGCFLDDETHALLGLEGRTFQALYHFAVGRPVEDPRLRTVEPYAHLRGR
ncbi:MAG TPA: SagB/ThcOx family dehydrogenase [Anaeromyxobacter sp.]|nr:SagB/ThcOx family dehydrogenase [Anaeromyxobacter sp.]